MLMGIPKKKSLLPLVMSGRNDHENEASVLHQNLCYELFEGTTMSAEPWLVCWYDF
jgi:hypothetical protein